MAKFEKNEMFQKIPLEQIDYGTNVREFSATYKDEETPLLAESIKKNGLLQPLVVRPAKEKDGEKKFEIIAGHRRYFALVYLQERGENVGPVPCVIQSSGKIKTLQMIENIQRKDLSQKDKESAIREMLDSGMTQKEIAEELSKPISYVSDILAGAKVRESVESAGVDTSKIGTRALSQLRSIEKEKLPEAVEKLSERGGTVKAATEILRESKRKVSCKECEYYGCCQDASDDVEYCDEFDKAANPEEFTNSKQPDSFVEVPEMEETPEVPKQKTSSKLKNPASLQVRDFWRIFATKYSGRLEEKLARDFYTELLEYFEGVL